MICPDCKKSYDGAHIFCPFCKTKSSIKFCPKCGKICDGDYEFCTTCGSKLKIIGSNKLKIKKNGKAKTEKESNKIVKTDYKVIKEQNQTQEENKKLEKK